MIDEEKRKLWVDDARPAPDASWDVATSSAEADAMFRAEAYAVVSLDYSLTYPDSGEDVIANWAEAQEWPGEVRLHSGSFAGRSLLARRIADCWPNGGGPKVVSS